MVQTTEALVDFEAERAAEDRPRQIALDELSLLPDGLDTSLHERALL